jgi:hypothetical protein
MDAPILYLERRLSRCGPSPPFPTFYDALDSQTQLVRRQKRYHT